MPPEQPPPGYYLTPEQQYAMHQQFLAVQRQQLELQRRNRNTVNTLVGLFVWTPLIILTVIGFVWLLVGNL